MHDPAYKLLFARPRMVCDLLDGFAARGWSGALDFDTVAPLRASFVSEDLQQRHGDLVWRIRFRDGGWLYLVLLLEFQATVDPAMALRMLTYTALLYQRLEADGVLLDRRALPPVLPVVLYNGRRPGIEQGHAQGIEQGRHEERALLCRQAARKFDAGAAEGLAAVLAGVNDPDRLARVGDWIIECATASELLARVRGDNGSGG